MTTQYTTSNPDVKVYNFNGGQIANIKTKGVVLNVIGQTVTLKDRGVCYPISLPFNGFVKTSDVHEQDVDEVPPPPPPLPIPFPGPVGNVRKIRRWGDPVTKEYGYDVNVVGTTNWQNFKCWNDKTGWGAVSNFLWIPRADVNRLSAMQIPDTHTVNQKMSWLCSLKGKIYFKSTDWKTDEKIAWGTTAIGGNYVQILDYKVLTVPNPRDQTRKMTMEMARLAGFRKTDWGRPLLELISTGLVHRCFCVYKNNQFGDSPNGVVYSPFWSPLDWDFAGNDQPAAFWLPTIWLE